MPAWKPVNANPGLKVNRSLNFSCIKMFFVAFVLSSLRLIKLKPKGKQCTENLKNQKIKILAYPWLAYSGFDQPGPCQEFRL